MALRDELLQWSGRDAFVFFFIDPKGWKDVGIETLRKLLQRPRSEFLINFMYDFVNRTMSMPYWQRDMAELSCSRIICIAFGHCHLAMRTTRHDGP